MSATIDRSTCLVEPSCSKVSHSCFTHVWHHLLGCPIVHRESPNFIRISVCTSALSVLLLRRSLKTDLHLLGLASHPLCLILSHQDHQNLSPHAPGDLGNLIDDSNLKNLHDFLQFGCSEHLRLHLRVFTAFVWLLDLFLLHNWDFNYSFSELPQFPMPLVSLTP